MDGTPSDMSERAQFARRLNGRFNLPVFTHDERLTTFEAKGQRLAQGQRGGYRENPSTPWPPPSCWKAGWRNTPDTNSEERP